MGLAAEKIEINKPIQELALVKSKPSVLDGLYHGKTKTAAIGETGEVFALALAIIAAFRQYHGRPEIDALFFLAAGFILFELSIRAPLVFYPIWKLWLGIGWVMEVTTSYLVLGLSWFGMMVPVGLFLKAIGIRTVDQSWKQEVSTYWETRTVQDFKLLERQF